MDYRFLLGRDFRLQERTFTVSALCKMDGIDVVRATACDSEEPMMHLLPAHKVVHYLVCDEEIELKIVSFAR